MRVPIPKFKYVVIAKTKTSKSVNKISILLPITEDTEVIIRTAKIEIQYTIDGITFHRKDIECLGKTSEIDKKANNNIAKFVSIIFNDVYKDRHCFHIIYSNYLYSKSS